MKKLKNSLILIGLFCLLSTPLFSQYKVLVIGDSYSIMPWSYTTQIFDPPNCNIIYIAEAGKTTGWALADLRLDSSKYDYTIVFIGLNDIYGRLKTDKIESNLDSIMSIVLRKTHKAPIIFTLPYMYDLSKWNQERYIDLYKVNHFIKQMDGDGIIVIDINEMLQNIPNAGQDLFMSDRIHMNPDGHYLLRQLLIEELMKE